MPHLMIGKILDSSPHVKKDGAAWLLPEELDANAYIALGQEVMQIPRLQRVELGADVVTLTTHKNERFYFPPEHVVGLRLGGPESKAARSSAGFFKGPTS
jgi:hypothetical protein